MNSANSRGQNSVHNSTYNHLEDSSKISINETSAKNLPKWKKQHLNFINNMRGVREQPSILQEILIEDEYV